MTRIRNTFPNIDQGAPAKAEEAIVTIKIVPKDIYQNKKINGIRSLILIFLNFFKFLKSRYLKIVGIFI